MSLARLDIANVRNIRSATLEPSPRFNIILGNNGSGKSSLLEAIYLLGRGKSFRTAKPQQAIHFEASALTVSGLVRLTSGYQIPLGVQVDKNGKEYKLSGKRVHSSSELAYALPLQLIHPHSHLLFEAGPAGRRQFIDWGLFHLDRNFLALWRQYKKILLQRNNLLKAPGQVALEAWDYELARFGCQIAVLREDYLRRLEPFFLQIVSSLMETTDYQLHYRRGWHRDIELLAALQRDREKDVKYGYTQSGPHKADFVLWMNGHPAQQIASRGQMKLLVIALILAQVRMMQQPDGNLATILIDDIASELDEARKKFLLDFLLDMQAQLFITTTDLKLLSAGADANATLFAIEQGCIQRG